MLAWCWSIRFWRHGIVVTADRKSLVTRNWLTKTTIGPLIQGFLHKISRFIQDNYMVVLYNSLSCCKTFAICCKVHAHPSLHPKIGVNPVCTCKTKSSWSRCSKWACAGMKGVGLKFKIHKYLCLFIVGDRFDAIPIPQLSQHRTGW